MALFAYSFLDNFLRDPGFAIELPIGPKISNREVIRRLYRARKLLTGRCRGLVEIRDHITWYNDPPFLAIALEYEITVVYHSTHEFLKAPETGI
jgi:hypothetical protein